MKTRNNTANKSILLIMVSTFMLLCLFVPVWQSAVSSQLKTELVRASSEVAAKEEQKMTLRAGISKQMTPEYLIEMARVRDLSFTQISSTGATAVASLH